MAQDTNTRVVVRGETYVIIHTRMPDLGGKFFGKIIFTLRLEADDGRRWRFLGKQVTANARLDPEVCQYCRSEAGPLEPFNQVWNMACVNTRLCKIRQALAAGLDEVCIGCYTEITDVIYGDDGTNGGAGTCKGCGEGPVHLWKLQESDVA
jgi:hypothetical protein